MREDRVLTPDEVPIFWSLNERQRAAFVRLANRLARKAVCIHGVDVGLAPFSAAVLPLSEMMQQRASQPFIGCGMSSIEEILERDRNSRG
jgi:hypothetical protein